MTVTTKISFGSEEIELAVNGQASPVDRSQPISAPIVDNAKEAVKQALAAPAGYPPLADAVLAGDRIVIAVDWGVPELPTLLAGILETLEAAHVAPANVCILVADERDAKRQTLLSGASARWQGVTVRWHDPHDRAALGYLAANRAGDPIYLSRAVLDADFVIPVSVRRPDYSLGDFGIYGGLFPSFADAATACHFASVAAVRAEGRESCRRAADEAGWLLGSRFTVQVIPAPGGDIHYIIAGDVDSVSTESQRVLSAAWNITVSDRADLVVACVSGTDNQQNWRNVARALEAAMQIVTADGSILICSQIGSYPGLALQRLSQLQEDLEALETTENFYQRADDSRAEYDSRADDEADQHDAESDRELELEETRPESPRSEDGADSRFSDDMMLASCLRLALPRHRVYLLSALEEDDVAETGLIHVSRVEEVANLCHRHRSYVILPDAQNVQASLRSGVNTM